MGDSVSNQNKFAVLNRKITTNSNRIGVYEANIVLTPSAATFVSNVIVEGITITSVLQTAHIITDVLYIDGKSRSYTTVSNSFSSNITAFSISNLIDGAQIIVNLYNSDSIEHVIETGSGTATSFLGSLTVPASNNAVFTLLSLNSNIFINGAIYS
jgi:hypothetical protein